MKARTIIFVGALLMAGVGRAWSAPPTVITQLSSNATTYTVYLRGAVNPNGSNTVAWFDWGSDTGLTGGSVSNQDIGAGTNVVFIDAYLSGLLSGTRYYYRCNASNETSGIVQGAIDAFVTRQINYDVTGQGIQDMDVNRPQGSEPGAVWADALRQVKGMLKNWVEVEHNDDGTMQARKIITPYIAPNSITWNKLSIPLQNLILSMIASNAALTNAPAPSTNTFQVCSNSYAAVTVPANGNVTNAATLLIPSNNVGLIQVTFDATLYNNQTAGYCYFQTPVVVGGVTVDVLTNTFRGYHHDSINGSYFLAGGQTTGDVIQIQSGDLYNHYGNTIAVNSLCVRSIP